LKTGDKHNLSYVIEPDNSSLTSVRYISTSPEIATVNDNGEIEALAVGETTIKATLYNSDLIATCTVYVTPTEIESITLNNHNLEIKHGDSDQLVAAIFPENATNKTITWKSSNSNIATVTDGIVRAVGIGRCTITASSTDGKSSDYCDVTVVPINVTGIHVYDKTVAV
ncbi:MAG: Ig domain-containing protein, partial [Muribaculaceae bacterium]|nr:Ig domain-containing protein [Muribaculaceae bacterium]